MVATGAILDGSPPLIPSVSVGVATPEEGRAAVVEHARAGVDMIKVYSSLDRDVLLAIVEEADHAGGQAGLRLDPRRVGRRQGRCNLLVRGLREVTVELTHRGEVLRRCDADELVDDGRELAGGVRGGKKLGFFIPGGWGLRDAGPLAIVFSLVVIGVAAFRLLMDFDMADQAVRAGAPAKFAWYIAFGLMTTLVWLYIEILRLLAKLNSRD